MAGTEAMLEAAFRTGDYSGAEATLKAARHSAEAEGDLVAEAGTLDQLAWLMHFRTLDGGRTGADPDAEEALFQRSLTIRRKIGDQAGTAASLFGLAVVQQVMRHDSEQAIHNLREATELADAHGDALLRSECHRHLGFYYLTADVVPGEAVRHLQLSLELRHHWGDPRWIPSGTLALGLAELAAGMRAPGLEHVHRAAREARGAGLSSRRIDDADDWVRRAEAGETPFAR